MKKIKAKWRAAKERFNVEFEEFMKDLVMSEILYQNALLGRPIPQWVQDRLEEPIPTTTARFKFAPGH